MQIIGHRGAKDLAPENTVAGVRFALRRNIDWIEFDVNITKDGELVSIHDSLQRLIKRRRLFVRHCTLAELRELAKASGHKLASFADLMKAIGDKAKVDIELKHYRCAPAVVEEINRQVAAGRPYKDFLITSMSLRPLLTVRKLNRRIPLGYIHEYLTAALPLTFVLIHRKVKLSAVVFWSSAAPRFAINLAKQMGLWVVVYTVNHRPHAEKLEELGVDAIITDRPQEFLPVWPLVRRFAFALFLIVVGTALWLVLR